MTPRTIAVANEKGGVGKTTTAVHLARAFALDGLTTILVDMDGQATATRYMLSGEDGRPPTVDQSVYDLLNDGSTTGLDVLQVSEKFQCGVLPSSMSLKTWMLEVVFGGDPDTIRQPILRDRLATFGAAFEKATGAAIDMYVIDAPPNFGALLLQSLLASDELLIPVTLEELSVAGIYTFTDTLTELNRVIDYEPEILGILPCMVDWRRRTQTPKKLNELQQNFGDLLVPKEMMIPVSSAIAKSGDGTTLPSGGDRAVKAYRRLAEWIVDERARTPATA
jgi:chromosome partitioning protein